MAISRTPSLFRPQQRIDQSVRPKITSSSRTSIAAASCAVRSVSAR